jgi:hypothetical protein
VSTSDAFLEIPGLRLEADAGALDDVAWLAALDRWWRPA